MKLWVLVYEEHYQRYKEYYGLEESIQSFQRFLKEIGTPSLQFNQPAMKEQSNYLKYLEVPEASCIRLRKPEEYVAVLHESLFQGRHEKQDKSRRSSSCSIV
jgi:hypothetical protein